MDYFNICIPTYNYNVEKLISELFKQCLKANIDFQLLVFEDGSRPENVAINSKLVNKFKIKHIISETNIGRSATRNTLAKNSKQGKIIFLDCDSALPSEKFIENYLQYIDKKIVCGGTIYTKEQYNKAFSLRYKYGIKREMKPASIRNINSNRAFATNNFMISTDIFDVIEFREFLKEYGHEDSLFGYELKQNNFNILHIDNPVIHEGLEDNFTFLDKTQRALKNLIVIEQSNRIDKEFFDDVKIIKNYKKIIKNKIFFLVQFFYFIFKNKMKNHLLKSNNPNLVLFDFYKLAYYNKLKKNYE